MRNVDRHPIKSKDKSQYWLAGAFALGGAALVYVVTQNLPIAEHSEQSAEIVAPAKHGEPKVRIAEAPPAAVVEPIKPEVTKPSFDTVRVAPDGNAVIAGRAAPGAEVSVMLNDVEIGKAKANEAGEFVLLPDKDLPQGTGSISLATKSEDKTVKSDELVAVIVKPKAQSEALVAVVKPDAPTKLVLSTPAPASPGDTVKVDTVDYDAEGKIIFSGRAKPGATARIYVDDAIIGEALADRDGKWVFDKPAQVAVGTHRLRADEVDATGQVTSRVELPLLREEPAKVAELKQEDVATPDQPGRIVIQPGNSLWRISRNIYGNGIQYTVIYEANRDQIRNPNLIYPGQIFSAPKL